MRNKFVLLILITTAICFQNANGAQIWAQVTATPARINLSTATPPQSQQLVTPPPTGTPTPIGLVVLEAITEANVRAEPDPESERLGTIRAGEVYTVLGRYFRWLQFQYNPSPTGRGWVFDELVTITGDESTIPDLTEQTISTVDPALLAVTQTLEAVTLTPGGILTATALQQILNAPVAASDGSLPLANNGATTNTNVLPTFTYPPNIATAASSQTLAEQLTPSAEEAAVELPVGVAPIIPIAVLGGLGALGLLISAARR